jgi:hypothetical protein
MVSSFAEAIFECADGYAPTHPMACVLGVSGLMKKNLEELVKLFGQAS